MRKGLFTTITLIAIAACLAACTTVGTRNTQSLGEIDFGPGQPLRICVLLDQDVSEDRARELMAGIGDELSQYGLEVSVPWIRPWVRPAFSSQGIVDDVWVRPLEAPCDRLMALVGRNFGDFLTGLLGFEILGGVDEPTHTRAYVVARSASLNQLFVPPSRVAVHEAYHLLGCHHGTDLTPCYEQIRKLKEIAARNHEIGSDFFPGITPRGKVLGSRLTVNQIIRDAVDNYHQTRATSFQKNY
jgi:hypothetical protein